MVQQSPLHTPSTLLSSLKPASLSGHISLAQGSTGEPGMSGAAGGPSRTRHSQYDSSPLRMPSSSEIFARSLRVLIPSLSLSSNNIFFSPLISCALQTHNLSLHFMSSSGVSVCMSGTHLTLLPVLCLDLILLLSPVPMDLLWTFMSAQSTLPLKPAMPLLCLLTTCHPAWLLLTPFSCYTRASFRAVVSSTPFPRSDSATVAHWL